MLKLWYAKNKFGISLAMMDSKKWSAPIKHSEDIIVLIHGLLRSHRSMGSLGRYLRKQGYNVVNYSYPSTQYTIKEHGDKFIIFIENILSADPHKKIHFITHSLGGIIVREALSNLPPNKLTKCKSLIMLAPPNQGSLFAQVCLTIAPILSRFIKPLAELSCDRDAYIHTVPIPRGLKIGIIAGRFDAKVPPHVSQLSNQDDFVIINSTHSFIMNHPKARKAIINFLKSSRF